MKRVFIILSLTVASVACYSQNVKQDASGNYVAIVKEDSATFSQSGKTYTDSKGIVYPVLVTNKGKLFVMKTSKTTGKQYRYYLKIK